MLNLPPLDLHSRLENLLRVQYRDSELDGCQKLPRDIHRVSLAITFAQEASKLFVYALHTVHFVGSFGNSVSTVQVADWESRPTRWEKAEMI